PKKPHEAKKHRPPPIPGEEEIVKEKKKEKSHKAHAPDDEEKPKSEKPHKSHKSKHPPPPPPPPPPPSLKTVVIRFLIGHDCATICLILIFFLVVITLWMAILVWQEKVRYEPLRKAIQNIRKFMVAQNPDLKVFNDVDIILEAEKLATQLLPWSTKLNEIEAEITNVQYKLNHDWMAYKGHLYSLNDRLSDYYEFRQYCEDEKAALISDISEEEEKFLEEVAQRKQGPYYIGLVLSYLTDKWQWYNLGTEPPKSYWMEGEPRDPYNNMCAAIHNECITPLMCWVNLDCMTVGRGICKQKPEDKWIN
ncbi:oxidized low-density lipoprotein receptor 1-like, partial [Pantherophis guttatus]|uniref:Oxidized low-density lipoprotein receptor 1-like n=1 Tax=Pantherophis guttatus TaxID=94885 RepID=A0ABM3ZI90_PANGU